MTINCDKGEIASMTFATVDPALTRTAPMTGPAFGTLDAMLNTADAPRLTVADFDGVIGDVLQFGCDDVRLSETYHVPLSKVDDDATYLPDEQG